MIQRIGVVGAGTMGCGIAQLCAQAGFPVKVHDPLPEALASLPARLKAGLEAAVLKGKLTTAQAERALHSVSPAKTLSELAGAELVIEAATEDLALKRALFAELGALCPDAILATNTSSLRVSDIAAGVRAPERVLGMHFFNPPVAMRLVELVRAPATSPEVFRAAWDFALTGLRKLPVDAADSPGFIVNRVMRPYYLAAMREAPEAGGIAALDKACRDAGKVPMGPFELMDLIGLEVNLAITKSIYEALGRPERLKPHPAQQRLVDSGALGRKAGKGWYLYRDGKAAGENPEAAGLFPAKDRIEPQAVWAKILHDLVLEAKRLADEKTASPSDIDLAVKLAMNFPKGPFEWLRENAPAKA